MCWSCSQRLVLERRNADTTIDVDGRHRIIEVPPLARSNEGKVEHLVMSPSHRCVREWATRVVSVHVDFILQSALDGEIGTVSLESRATRQFAGTPVDEIAKQPLVLHDRTGRGSVTLRAAFPKKRHIFLVITVPPGTTLRIADIQVED